ncbi:MAG: hypothetical protein B6D41_19125 [Chloroflexi bacterium UTCFX4]|jgi:CheY-like chemotaxis protein|nr:MAG: hypothetical protein B6D41_19125 [Chloroflexi bacterium UTCFX4]
MSDFHWKRILVVEDRADQREHILLSLAQAGYEPLPAADFASAQHLLRSEHFHLGIFDINLNDPDHLGKNELGLELLKDVAELNLGGIFPVVFLSNYLTKKSLLRMSREINQITAWYPLERKQLRQPPPPELLKEVKRFFDEYLKINFDIAYDPESRAVICRSAAQLAEKEDRMPSTARLEWQLKDILGKLFADATELVLRELNQGFSGAVVLEARPMLGELPAKPLVVKVSRRDKIQTEARNYEQYVKPLLLTEATSHLDRGPAYSQHLGGIAYTSAFIESDAARDLDHFWREHSDGECVHALEQLFRTLGPWFETRDRKRPRNVRELYIRALGLEKDASRLPDAVRATHPDWDWDAPRLWFDPPGRLLPNPLLWFQQGDARATVSESITHGDLHTRNVMMNPRGQAWLIDFYRTGPSHLLRDLVILETDLKFRCMEDISLELLCEIEALLFSISPRQAHPKIGLEMSPQAEKIVRMLLAIRRQVWKLIGSTRPAAQQEAEREFGLSLLMATLNVTRLAHFKNDPALRPRLHWAILSAALLCERLE